MRLYDLTLTNPQSGAVVKKWTSYPSGQFDPGALNVMFDIITSVGSIPVGAQSIIIEGVSLSDLDNAKQYGSTIQQDGSVTGGVNLTLKGGMGAGLPLANPSQAGTLTQSAVFQSFGNWTGTDMSLALIVVPSSYSHGHPGNIVLNWQKGQKLSDALQPAFAAAYPKAKASINISSSLVAVRNETSFHGTFSQLARHVARITASAPNGAVEMSFQNGAISVFDNTAQPPIVLFQFTDFVGQPTWLAPQLIQVKTVMRGDIQVGNNVAFPVGFENAPGFVQTSQASQPGFGRYKSAIQGKFTVTQVRQIGNFRDPDGAAWSTVFNCVPVP